MWKMPWEQTIINGCDWRLARIPDLLEELQLLRRAFIQSWRLRKKKGRVSQSKLTLMLHCYNISYWRPGISSVEGTGPSCLKIRKSFEVWDITDYLRDDVPYLMFPQCLTAFQIGPVLLGKITMRIKFSDFAHSWMPLKSFMRDSIKKDF